MIGLIRRSFALLSRTARRRMYAAGLFGVVIAILDSAALLVLLALMNFLLDRPGGGPLAALFGDGRTKPGPLLALVCGLFVVRSVLSIAALWFNVSASQSAHRELTARILRGHARASHLLRLERGTADALRSLTSISNVIGGVILGTVSLVGDIAIVVATSLGLLIADPAVATAVTVYFAGLALLWLRVAKSYLRRKGRALEEFSHLRTTAVLHGILAAKELQLRGRSEFFTQQAIDRSKDAHHVERPITVVNGSLRFVFEAALVLGAALVVVVAGSVGGSDSALPAVGLVVAAAFRLLPALNRMLFLANNLQVNVQSIEVVEADVEAFGDPDGQRAGEAVEAYVLRDSFELRDVSFVYPTRSEPAIDSVSLAIRAGESFGIVGPSGSGKSTLLDVVLGLLPPKQGSVLLDGEPIGDRVGAWQRSIGYVAQDVVIVDDTFAGNVALGWSPESIDHVALADAVRLADLADVVADLPSGVNTLLGSNGVRLSGGQRQRLGLARALYHRPRVLVLDEATSSLDPATEERIVRTLDALSSDLTMVVVSHRVSTVRGCDRLIYLDHGTVRAAGTFADIVRSVPEFAAAVADPSHVDLRTDTDS